MFLLLTFYCSENYCPLCPKSRNHLEVAVVIRAFPEFIYKKEHETLSMSELELFQEEKCI